MRGNYKNLSTLVNEVERIESIKNDYLVPSNNIRMFDDNSFAVNDMNFGINSFAHGQVAEKLGIPKKYYDAMEAIPGLRTINVNEWLREKQDSKYLVRTLDGTTRAFLSDRYRPIDNYDVLSSFLPVIKGMDVKIQPNTLSLTETKMYIPVIFPTLEGEVKKGDVVQAGIILTNSEVGAGAVDIKRMVWRLVCSNGLISASVLRKYHIGSRIDEENFDLFANDTILAELDAFKLRMRDIIKDALNPQKFQEYLLKMQGAAEDKIRNVNETVANITKRFGLSEKHNDLIINNMVEEGNLNRYGLANGLTALAHDLDNIDAQYEVEKMGAQVIEMSRTEWGKYVAA